jgi:hypothetical protein
MKKLSIISSGFGLYLMSALPAFAVTTINPCPPPGNPFRRLCSLTFEGGLFGRIIVAVFVIAVLIALAFLIFGGIKWIISGGDKAGVEGARNMIVAALVGLVVVFLSYFILNLLLGFFGLGLGDLRIPSIAG